MTSKRKKEIKAVLRGKIYKDETKAESLVRLRNELADLEKDMWIRHEVFIKLINGVR